MVRHRDVGRLAEAAKVINIEFDGILRGCTTTFRVLAQARLPKNMEATLPPLSQ